MAHAPTLSSILLNIVMVSYDYHILPVLRSVLILNIRPKKNKGMHYKPDVNSHGVTLDCMRDGLKEVRYKEDMHVSL